MLAEFYDNVLYPIQDKAIATFKDSAFYLTGAQLFQEAIITTGILMILIIL